MGRSCGNVLDLRVLGTGVFHWCSMVSESVRLNSFLLEEEARLPRSAPGSSSLDPRRLDNSRMGHDVDHPPSTGDVGRGVDDRRPVQRTIEAAAEFERTIAAAERDGPAPDVHPRVHRAMIEAMRSELDVLRQQLGTR